MTTFPASSGNEVLLARVRANLEAVRDRVTASGRDVEEIRLVAMTKGFGVDEARAAIAAGLTTLGENYVDELEAKRAALGDLGARWHFVGALQTNKIARALAHADLLGSVGRAKEVDHIASLRADAVIDVQVDFGRDPGRNGVAPEDAPALVERARERGLAVRGLMTVAPLDQGDSGECFSRLAALADELGVRERSMGMSEDLESACRAGTTELRLGRALFGPRVRGSALA